MMELLPQLKDGYDQRLQESLAKIDKESGILMLSPEKETTIPQEVVIKPQIVIEDPGEEIKREFLAKLRKLAVS